MTGAFALGALILGLLMILLTGLAIAAIGAEATVYETHDFQRAIWAEREGLRILRARYASGLVSPEEYRRLAYELEAGRSLEGCP